LIKSPPPTRCRRELAQKLFPLQIPASSLLHYLNNTSPNSPNNILSPGKLNVIVLFKKISFILSCQIHQYDVPLYFPTANKCEQALSIFALVCASSYPAHQAPFPVLFKALLRVAQEAGVCTKNTGQ